MLNVIKTLGPRHYFFDKSYVPQLRAASDDEESDKVEGIPASFFDNLPVEPKRPG